MRTILSIIFTLLAVLFFSFAGAKQHVEKTTLDNDRGIDELAIDTNVETLKLLKFARP